MSNILGVEIPKLNWEASDLCQEYNDFKQYCELIFKGPYSDKSAEEKVNYVLLWLGKKGINIFNTWHLNAKEQKDINVLFKKFKEYFAPKSNIRIERY